MSGLAASTATAVASIDVNKTLSQATHGRDLSAQRQHGAGVDLAPPAGETSGGERGRETLEKESS